MNWLTRQFEWIKGFFDDDEVGLDTDGHNPSHKNLLAVATFIVFSIAYLKKVAISPEMPDIPPGWQMVLLGVLGIMSAMAGTKAYFKSKSDDDHQDDQPKK